MKTPWASIAKISIGGKHSGTGFLVTRQHVVTAYHVVRSGRLIKLRFDLHAEYGDSSKPIEIGARIVEAWSSEAEDFAVLECVTPLPERIQPLRLGGAFRQADPFYSSGFGENRTTRLQHRVVSQ